jgi:hypothetical protein
MPLSARLQRLPPSDHCAARMCCRESGLRAGVTDPGNFRESGESGDTMRARAIDGFSRGPEGCCRP